MDIVELLKNPMLQKLCIKYSTLGNMNVAKQTTCCLAGGRASRASNALIGSVIRLKAPSASSDSPGTEMFVQSLAASR